MFLGGFVIWDIPIGNLGVPEVVLTVPNSALDGVMKPSMTMRSSRPRLSGCSAGANAWGLARLGIRAIACKDGQ